MNSFAAHNDNKSIRTFFIYAIIVFVFIIISLTLKAFLIFQQSRFDGKDQFLLAVENNETVKELIVFHPSEQTVTVISLGGEKLLQKSLGKSLGVVPDARVTTSFDLPLNNVSATMRDIAFHYYSLKTNLTLFDVLQLMVLSQKIASNNETTKTIVVSKDTDANDKVIGDLFTDEKIFSDNVSIQIVNASGAPGLGKRLERSLTHLGCNVISIGTAHTNEHVSKIVFFGEETYTVKKLKKLLAIPATRLEKQQIADIIITLGEDKSNVDSF